MRRALFGVLAALALCLCAQPARAQGIPIPGDSYGFCYNLAVPQTISASCTLTFYDAGTTNLSTGLFQNEGLTIPFTNPGAAGTNGTWRVYVAASSTQAYDVRVSGGVPALTPYTILNIIPGGGGGGNVKPSSAAGIVFVSLQGNDSNDCLSWGTSCLTIVGGYNKLPADGGTIYVTAGVQSGGPKCTPVSGQGLGIAGSADPNYASMPTLIGSTYWVKAKSGFSGVTIQGVSANTSGQNATTGAGTPITCGGANDGMAGTNQPAFWFSYTQGISLFNLALAYPKQGIFVNVDSNGDATGSLGTGSNFNFENLQINICNSCDATPGPNIWIGGSFLWLKMTNLGLQGNANNATVDGRSAILIKTGGGGMAAASGLIHMEHINSTSGGNFVLEPDWDIGTGGFDIQDWTMEGSSTPTPIVNIGDGGAIFGGDIQRLVMSDAALSPWVHVPSTVSPYFVHIHPQVGQDAVTLDGPMDIIGEMRVGGISGVAKIGQAAVATVAPQAMHQVGYPLGRAAGIQNDTSRRLFQSFARFTNLANQDASTWTATTGDSSITTGQTGPDNTNRAAKVSSTVDSQGEGAYVYSATVNWQPGDYYYIGVWARAASTNGVAAGSISSSELCLCFPFSAGPTTKLIAGSYGANAGAVLGASASPQTDGEWQYLWAVGKAIDGFGNAGTRLEVHSTHANQPMFYENPVVAIVPASTFALVAAPTFSSGSESGNIVTMVTTGAHGLSPGEPLVISGCTPSSYNGEKVIIETPLTTSFTYYNSVSGLGAASGCVITPGGDSEAADWGQNTAAWANGAPANTIVAPRGVLTSISGPGNFFGTFTHANTANRIYTFPDAAISVAGDTSFACGTTATCVNTAVIAPHQIWGRVNLSSGTPSTATVSSISPAFTSTTSYQCVLTDMTTATNNLLKVVNTSTSSFTITGPDTITDTISYVCIGN